MRKNDKQLGTPFINYTDSKSNVEAIQGLVGGEVAYSNQGQLGYYNHVTGAWVWITNAGGGGGSSIFAQDEGDPLGTVTTFNFIGGVVDVSVSGTVARVFITGSSGGTSVHNDLTGLQGGQAGQYFHLNSTQIIGLASGTYTNLHFHSGTSSREVLTADRTYYVRTDGNDSNTGLVNNSGGAFLTIQKAIDVTASLDLSIYDVTIQIADGTYTGAVVINKAFIGSGSVTIQGNSGTPANVLISTTSADCFNAKNGATIEIKDMKLRTTTTGRCLYAENQSIITFSNIVFDTCAQNHIQATVSSAVRATGNYSITGGASRHMFATGVATIEISSITVTLTGTPAFSVTFAVGSLLGLLSTAGITFSGSATGQRYNSIGNGVIYTNGGGANYFPGNSAGSTATGGQYI